MIHDVVGVYWACLLKNISNNNYIFQAVCPLQLDQMAHIKKFTRSQD